MTEPLTGTVVLGKRPGKEQTGPGGGKVTKKTREVPISLQTRAPPQQKKTGGAGDGGEFRRPVPGSSEKGKVRKI